MDIEHWVHEYIVTLYLLKIMDRDRKHTGGLKLGRFVNELFDKLSRTVEAEHIGAKKELRSQGCRIVLDEVTEHRNVHVMYVFRGYEHHCMIMPAVLRSKCEAKLKELLRRVS